MLIIYNNLKSILYTTFFYFHLVCLAVVENKNLFLSNLPGLINKGELFNTL